MSRSNTDAQTSLPMGSLSQFSPVFLKIHLLFLYIVGSLDKIDIYDYQFMVQKQLLKFYLSILPELLCKIHNKKTPRNCCFSKVICVGQKLYYKKTLTQIFWLWNLRSFSEQLSEEHFFCKGYLYFLLLSLNWGFQPWLLLRYYLVSPMQPAFTCSKSTLEVKSFQS